mmetsp:Transcript_560/g.958  ORF Transcript_560/g.958 Transcript_560/m.958 type:complete len:532 (+) Transcript_560:108-1703(+)
MSGANTSSEVSEETPRVKTEVEETTSGHQNVTNMTVSAAPPPSDSAPAITDNNTDLTEQIINAIALTNSVSGMAQDPDPLKLESLFPGDNVCPTGQTLGTAASTAGAAPVGAPVTGQELSLLSLFSHSSNLLTPNEMALPTNDPSIFMPTPFAPGEDANTLIQQQEEQPPPPAPPAATDNPTNAPIDDSTTPAASQQHLLEQLATAYFAGGQQPIFPQGPSMGAPVQQSLVSGLMTQNYLMGGNVGPMGSGLHSAFAGIPPGLNPGIPSGLNPGILPGLNPGIPQGFNRAIAGIPSALHPGFAGVPATLHRRGMASLSNMGNSAPHATISEPSTYSLPTNQPNINGTMASMPMQPLLVPDQQNMFHVEASTAAMPGLGTSGDSAPQHNSDAISKRDTSSPAGGDLLIKSREARWIIRYNELLEFRGEHGHCRVPHGYAANRKLSWWVMNQRAQFAHRNQRKKTWLTDDRIQLLNDIGFIWTPHLKRSSGGKKKERSLWPPGKEEKKETRKSQKDAKSVKEEKHLEKSPKGS